MADYDWPTDLVPYQMTFYLQAHTGGTESPFTRQTKVYGLSAPRWVCRMSFRGGYDGTGAEGEQAQQSFGPRLDAFLAKLKGRENRVRLWDFRREGGAAIENEAVETGATKIRFPDTTTGLNVGDYVGGDGRPHIVRDVKTVAGDLIAHVEPPFGDDIVSGAATFVRVSGPFRLTNDDAAANPTEVGGLVSYDLEFVEDVPTLEYLPMLGSGAEYHSVWSTERLIASYDGPLAKAAGVDLGDGALRIRPADVATARGVNPIARIETVYDQSGSGHNATQPTADFRPGLREEVLTNGRVPIIIDGKRSDLVNAQVIGLEATIALTGRDLAAFFVVDATNSYIRQMIAEVTNGSGRMLLTFPDPLWGALGYGNAFATAAIEKKLPSCPSVLVVRETATAADIFLNGTRFSVGATVSAESLTNIFIGYSQVPSFDMNTRLLAAGTIDGAPSDGEVARLTEALTSRFRVAPADAPLVTLSGDSILEGVNSTYTRGPLFYWRDLLDQPVQAYNFGEASQLLSAMYARRAQMEGAVFDEDRVCVAVIQGGINDIQNSVSGATLYSGTTTPYVAYLKGLGYRVVVCTLLPETANTASFIEPARLAYNALVRTNAAGADVICDFAADPTMGVYPTSPNDLTLYPDKIHPSSLGYSYLGPIYAAAIQAAIDIG